MLLELLAVIMCALSILIILNEVKDAIKWALDLDEPSVIVARYPCAVKKYTEADLKEFGPLVQ
jgi:TPP-dependent indolepyruvate ferredoxin oxidoreductase alpha subunit